ncbi:hypothetical protein T4B_4010 [Trichinella pseudospiralis]|uniref:Uncharacterized protein n=1 Tax=Trichinella pseudospiralis TaxID=6337 RepID=A0A0V1I6U0_TRIPS|nr:hypothetical protein T4B_4010 [Trichinella pseudospiralis]
MSQSDQTVVKAFGEEKRRYNEPCQSNKRWRQAISLSVGPLLYNGHGESAIIMCRWTVIDHQLNNGQGANSGRPLSRLSDQLPPFHRLLSARFGQVGTDKSASGQVCVKRKSPARFSFS